LGEGSSRLGSKGDSRSIIDRGATVAVWVELREISNEDGYRLLRIVRSGRWFGGDLAAGADCAIGVGGR